jgi:ribosomal protein S18 acetylase RimI-like enzyme
MTSALAISSASPLSLRDLAALWNRAYEGYVVALNFSPEVMERHVARAGVDLELSRVLWLDDEACGISLAARRGDRSYLAGFGIAQAQRGQGLARRLIDAQLEALRERSLTRMQLEVIEHNVGARSLYSKAGFVERRWLLVLDGVPHSQASSPLRRIEASGFDAVHRRLNAARRPTWRREWPGVAQSLGWPGVEAVALDAGDGVTAYALWQDGGGERLSLLDAAALDERAASLLWRSLGARQPQRALRLVDEPDDSPLARAAEACGLHCALRQVEMSLEL